MRNNPEKSSDFIKIEGKQEIPCKDGNILTLQVGQSTVQFSVLLDEGCIVLEGPTGGQRIFCKAPEVAYIGRRPNSQIHIDNDDLVSATHASVYIDDGKLYLKDEGSTNGTFLSRDILSPSTDSPKKKKESLVTKRRSFVSRLLGR